MKYRITFDNNEWTTPLPAHQIIRIAEAAGVDGWAVMDPLHSPVVLVSTLSVLLSDATGVPHPKCAEQVMRVSMNALIGCVEVME